MNWYDFFTKKQKPIFKSIVDKTKYIKDYALTTGRIIIPEDWSYDGNAHSPITFKSTNQKYMGFEFQNSWNQISNKMGYSVQAMSNKGSYYEPLIKEFGYQLERQIIDEQPVTK